MKIIVPVLLSVLLSACQSAPTLNNTVLLGEVHDNEIGHQQRYAWLEKKVAQGWRPAIAMEQFDRERQGDIERARKQHPNDVDYLIKTVGGERWDWRFYKPVIALAYRYDLPILAANLSRKEAGELFKKGRVDLQGAEGVNLNDPLPAKLIEQQRVAVQLGHCGQLPVAMEEKMARAQIARDRVMAATMLPYQSRGVVLLAGNGHVRRDIGVPQWLTSAYSVGFIESKSEANFDEVYLIPAAERVDSCASFQMKK
ncbi:ChaN family lipoprotein [Deefgea tanakiae]|uniref:ChaN family lipoprotein n=1 Tax=Deefgea tanakiae TaxID=2865840 RepID=A0ABX8Z612_9NEIS|nr:ChaN family lipoprotein [Deefgea tanakiae]QZA78013.1 ChaN family lipoprotein [Deefgea tanakiae]